MYTSYIGKIFLDEYNKRNNQELTAEDFFDSIMFPLFFDNEKYLMRVKNSPFDQLTTSGAKKGLFKIQNERINANKLLKEKIYKQELAVHTLVGYGELNTTANTYSQITNTTYNYTTEDYYLSWIGNALAIKTSGFNMLINNPIILFNIFEGWNNYRLLLNETPKLIKNQINSWNCNWLLKSLDNPNNDINISSNILDEKDGSIFIKSPSWSQLFLSLAKKNKNDNLILYLYEIGDKNNTTLGFINLHLSEVNEIYEARDKYFLDKKETHLRDEEIEKLETFYNLKTACKFGSIGLKSLEPKQLREFLPKGSYDYSKGNDFKKTENNNFNYLIIILWISAMLNKKELLDLADRFAKILYDYENLKENTENRGKTGKSQNVKELLENFSLNKFLEKLSTMISDMKDNIDTLKQIEIEVLTMPKDNFPLFTTLIKFELNILKNKEK